MTKISVLSIYVDYKMAYRVLQNGKRCSQYKIGDWDIDTFETKKEAELFAYMWVYPVSSDEAKKNDIEMILDVEYQMNNVSMMIIETIDGTDENWDNQTLGCDEKYVEVSTIDFKL